MRQEGGGKGGGAGGGDDGSNVCCNAAQTSTAQERRKDITRLKVHAGQGRAGHGMKGHTRKSGQAVRPIPVAVEAIALGWATGSPINALNLNVRSAFKSKISLSTKEPKPEWRGGWKRSMKQVH